MLDTLNTIDEYVKTHSEIGGQRSVQQVPRHSDQAPHTLDSWAHKKELTVSHQMPNAQDQDQTDRADIHGEGWCGTLLQIVCNHATQIGGRHMNTFFEHETIHSLSLYPTEGNYSRESQARSAH